VTGVRCPSCSSVLPDGARFCPACGTAVAAAAPSLGAAVEERRVVTVVFADLAGFTTLAEGRDPEAVKELLDRCFGALVPVVEGHGGHVDKIIGDELMAVFGAPVAHEDDAERAVRSALGLAAALEAPGPGLVLRVGINTGEVLAGPVGPGGAYTVTGDTVNTAHRLVSVARPGEVLVGERTWAATVDAIAYEARPAYHLRGKSAPVRAWAAVGTRRGPGRGALGLGAPLVGRDDELAVLAAEAERAFADGRAGVVAVTGEAGLGKTRLALELAITLWRSRPECELLWAGCDPYGGAGALDPLADLVRSAFGVETGDPRPAQHHRLAEGLGPVAAAVGADVAVLTARIAQLLGLAEPGRGAADGGLPARARVADELVGAVRIVLEGLAATRPVLVVFDDLQWADDAVLGLLRQLAGRGPGRPLLAVALARELPAAADWPGPALALAPLDREAAARLLHGLLAGPGDPAGVGAIGPAAERRLLDAGGGNPLLLEELVRWLSETGAITEVGGRWLAATNLATVGLPDGVRSLIGARLDALPLHQRRFLQDAAIVGRSFWREAVAALDDHADVDGTVDALVTRGVIEPHAADDPAGDLAFRHGLTSEVAYAAVPLGERARKHARVAAWLRNRWGPEGEAAVLGLVAHHYERAVALDLQLGHTDHGLAATAVDHLVRAARDAHARDALRDADGWYQRARDLGALPAGRDAPHPARVALEHGVVLVGLRRLDAAAAAFEEVLARDGDGGPMTAEAIARLGAVDRLRGDVGRSRSRFEDAQARWRAIGDPLGEAATLRLQGWVEVLAGRSRFALPRLLRALDLERSTGEETAETLQSLGWCEFQLGSVPAARGHLWRAAGRFAERGDPAGIGWCLAILGFTLLQEGRVAQAADIGASLRAQARSQGDPWAEGICSLLLAASAAEAGDLVEARQRADDADRLFAELGDPWGEAAALRLKGTVARAAGDRAEARRWLAAGLDRARRVGAAAEEARLLAEIAAVAADAGEREEAARAARAALAVVRGGGGERESEVRALVALARAVGEGTDDARLLLEEAVGLRGDGPATTAWRHAAAALALLEADGGDGARALALAAEAADGSEESAETRDVAAAALSAAVAAASEQGGARSMAKGAP
jgi:class 3 adenylate cyclase/tetratricopeptide (TPR) repeat protein